MNFSEDLRTMAWTLLAFIVFLVVVHWRYRLMLCLLVIFTPEKKLIAAMIKAAREMEEGEE